MCRNASTPTSVWQIEELESGAPGRLKVTAKSTESDEMIEGEYNTVSTDQPIQSFYWLICHCTRTVLMFSKANFEKVPCWTSTRSASKSFFLRCWLLWGGMRAQTRLAWTKWGSKSTPSKLVIAVCLLRFSFLIAWTVPLRLVEEAWWLGSYCRCAYLCGGGISCVLMVSGVPL